MINLKELSGVEIYLSEYVNREKNINDLHLIQNEIKNLSWNKLKFKIVDNDYENSQITFKLPKSIEDKIIKYNSENRNEYDSISHIFTMNVDRNECFNRTHTDEIPNEFLGLGLGYKMYKTCAKKLGYIFSDSNASESAQKVWSHLIRDTDFYTILNEDSVIVFDKKLSDSVLEEIVVKYLKKGFSIPNTINKDWIKKFYKRKNNNIIYIDSELCKRFPNKNWNLLNISLMKRYFRLKEYTFKKQYKDINDKYPKPRINQKCFYSDDNGNFHKGKISAIYNDKENENPYHFKYDYKKDYEIVKREEIIIREDSNIKWDFETDFNLPIVKKVNDDCYVYGICDSFEYKNRVIEYQVRDFNSVDTGFKFVKSVNINNISKLEKDKKYLIEHKNQLLLVKILKVKSDKKSLSVLAYYTDVENNWRNHSIYKGLDYIYTECNKKKQIQFSNITKFYDLSEVE